MAFDPSVISQIGSTGVNPASDASKAYTLANLADESKLNKLKLGEEEKLSADQGKIKSIIQSGKYDTSKGYWDTTSKLTAAGYPQAAQQFMKLGTDVASGRYQQQLDKLTLAGKKQDIVAGALDNVIAKVDAIKGADPNVKTDTLNAVARQLITADADQLVKEHPELAPMVKSFMSNPANLTYAGVVALEQKSNEGQKLLTQRRQELQLQLNQKKEATTESSAAEHARHDRATEATATAKTANSGFTSGEQGLLAALADKHVSLPAGMRSQADIKAEVAGLIKRHPEMTSDQIADGLLSGTLKFTAESKGAQVAGAQIGKVALAANELDTFSPQVLAASNAIPRGSFIPWSKLKNLGRSKLISSPALLTFKAKMQALENAYNQLAARSGTDADKREHIHELFDAANSNESVQALVTALNQEAAAARSAADRTIAETSGSAIPGAGAPGSGGPPPPVQTSAPVGTAGSSAKGSPAKVASDADYNALPSGAVFIAPDGTTRKKP